MRTIAIRRHNSIKKAIRKRKLSRMSYNCDIFNNLHQYSKNKVHCSCSKCSAKTKNKGKRRNLDGNYEPYRNWSHRDRKNLDKLYYEYYIINIW